MSSQSFGSGDFLKILFAVKDNIMRDIKVASFARVKSYNSKTNEYIVEPFPQLQNENKVISCVSISSTVIQKNNLVLILFLDRNFLQNLKQYNLKTNLTYLQNLSDLHSEKYGVIISNLNSSVNVKVPTKTSELENDSGFITKAVNDLINYYSKNEIDRALSEINDKIDTISATIETYEHFTYDANENLMTLDSNFNVTGVTTFVDEIYAENLAFFRGGMHLGVNDEVYLGVLDDAFYIVSNKRPVWNNSQLALSSDLDTFSPKQAGVYFVDGNTTGTAGVWTGSNANITSYYNGLVVNYKVGIAGASTTTLNINGLGAKTCYLRGTTALTTQYAVGTMVILSYNATTDAFYSSDYDANNYAYVRQYATTTDADYPMLFAYTTTVGDSYNTQYTRKCSKIKGNPATGIITYNGGDIATTSVWANNITITAGIWAIQVYISGLVQDFFVYIDETNNADANRFLNLKFYNQHNDSTYLQITSATIGGNYVLTYYNASGSAGTGRINYARIG